MALTSKLPDSYDDLDDDKKRKAEAVLQSLNNGVGLRDACRAADLADVTFYRWRKKYPWIQEAMEIIAEARVHVVEDTLYKTALGYEYEESKTTIEGQRTATGTKVGRFKQREERKRVVVEPNLTAIIFILKNRSNGKWRSDHHLKIDVNDNTNRDGAPIDLRERIRNMPTEQLRKIREMGALLIEASDDASDATIETKAIAADDTGE
jgi:hypothetical protein